MAKVVRKGGQGARDLEGYFASASWIAERAARAGVAVAAFAEMAKREVDKFETYFPHPFKPLQEKRINAYREHIWTAYFKAARQ